MSELENYQGWNPIKRIQRYRYIRQVVKREEVSGTIISIEDESHMVSAKPYMYSYESGVKIKLPDGWVISETWDGEPEEQEYEVGDTIPVIISTRRNGEQFAESQ